MVHPLLGHYDAPCPEAVVNQLTQITTLTGQRVAIANRAEIAVRVAATCRRLGLTPILLLDDEETASYAARQIGRVVTIGPAGSLLDIERVIAGAQQANADILHPGYGFLSERAALAEACAAAGIRFVGPSPDTLRRCGDKLATREAAVAAGVPVLPASPPLSPNPEGWIDEANAVGYPLIVKPAEAGGGRGMRRVAAEVELAAAVQASRREAASSGAGDAIYLERELTEPRHVEVQVAGDGRAVLALGDRDCSLQRRHQKVIEEAPAPNLSRETRSALHAHARAVAEAVGLNGIATCEFLLGADGTLAFLEVNPRLQVEHPVTEIVTGVDLVEWQLRLAAGEPLPLATAPEPRGHALEARVYAEDPATGFLPSLGELAIVSWPRGPLVRVDAGYARGDTVGAAYDAMLAKVVTHGADRDAALAALIGALRDTLIAGVATNLPWLLAAAAQNELRLGHTTTQTAARIPTATLDRAHALAAAVAWTIDRRDAADAWAAAGPFRLVGPALLPFHGDDWDVRVAVTQQSNGWQITIAGTTAPLRWLRDLDGVWTILHGDTVTRFAIAERDGQIEIAGGGGRWLIRRGSRGLDRARQEQRVTDGRVRAPLTARVLHVTVAPGDRVESGQTVATLEAMKMELACAAPAAGTVEAVACRPGDIVETGALLVTLRLEATLPLSHDAGEGVRG